MSYVAAGQIAEYLLSTAALADCVSGVHIFRFWTLAGQPHDDHFAAVGDVGSLRECPPLARTTLSGLSWASNVLASPEMLADHKP